MHAQMSSFQSDNPIVQRILDGSAPEPIRQAAARGALPLDPDELLQVLYVLSADSEDDVRKAVDETVAGIEDSALAGMVRPPDLSPALLDFVARRCLDKPDSLDTLIGQGQLPDATLEHLASLVPAASLELIATNQVRLIRHPAVIDAILANQHVTADIRRRMHELREEFFVKKEAEEKFREEQAEERELNEQQLAALQEKELAAARADLAAGKLQEAEKAAADTDDDDDITSATAKIASMRVPEKIRLALRGSRTERAILIRDPNRLVATTVIKSPKMTESEVELIANMRNVQEEVLRIVGTGREWLRSYKIVLLLVKNPRTPIPIALNLMSRLTSNDMKKLQSDRNISEALRKQAKIIVARQDRRSTGAKR